MSLNPSIPDPELILMYKSIAPENATDERIWHAICRNNGDDIAIQDEIGNWWVSTMEDEEVDPGLPQFEPRKNSPSSREKSPSRMSSTGRQSPARTSNSRSPARTSGYGQVRPPPPAGRPRSESGAA
eukprot:354155_1